MLHHSVDSEAVTDSIDSHMARNTSETEHWEHLIIVVGLDNATHIENGFLVLIVRSKVVQRGWIGGLTIGGCVINGKSQRYFPTSSQIVDERRQTQF